LIPISDANPTKKFPILTVAIIVANIVIFLFVQPNFGTGEGDTIFFYQHAPVPCQLDHSCPSALFEAADANGSPTFPGFLLLLVYSSFFHAGLLHIAGNMLFLWVFGNNIEDYLGKAKFVGFYLLGAIASGLAHVAFTLATSPRLPVGDLAACLNGLGDACDGIGRYIPSVGASGAVAAVMGAYLVLFPRARVNVLVPIVIIWTVIQMSAFVVLGLWFLYQFLIGAPDIAGVGENSVAWMAHVGGFVFGAIAIFILGGRPHHPESLWARGYSS
jgi:membrane associated rhomboid family serine protease